MTHYEKYCAIMIEMLAARYHSDDAFDEDDALHKLDDLWWLMSDEERKKVESVFCTTPPDTET
jgi:hypothetical protein